MSRRRVQFESIDFNKRYIATVPSDHDPVALRELFSPAFIDWITRLPAEVDFGITDSQLFFHWRPARADPGGARGRARRGRRRLQGLQREMAENGLTTYNAGPVERGPGALPDSRISSGCACRPQPRLIRLPAVR